ncbi:Cleavage stimulating factor like [Actinidia chinensis var. chinensis]|uniref:Cleavage stimulating factor like n=1 Tax=Actinidia chinensis var. chinensis TaxID=1590841 RepID=A0A2R6QYH5_ACTCC|nr:Cleavage stimulating factor like [Actinidia chinensis var. chinensis]
MAGPQHRCVFVGNIPYDATEEQLVQICEEVGPVVSFRLVIDRETGKPKGYGFCEYKDEETALSARRNLQGYEINGRQLRVDFAENDKNADRNREQGRGGPGMVANVGPQKQFGGPTTVGDSGFLQPIGLQVAMTAASVMTGVLGGAQGSRELNQNGLQGQPASYSDPLTLHLAKMSRNQLNEVMSELKVMATEKKDQARQLLLANPQLPKALFQAQIMLGMVTPQMLQMPNIRQASGPHAQPLSQDGQQSQLPVVSNLPGLPPLARNKMQFGLMPREQEAQVSSLRPNSLAHNQYSAFPQLPTQAHIQLPQLAQNQVVEQGTLPGYTGYSTLPPIRPPPLISASAKTQNPAATPFYSKQQVQPPLLQQEGHAGAANLGHQSQLIAPNTNLQTSLLTRPPISNQNFQPGNSMLSSNPDMINKDTDRQAQGINPSTWAQRIGTYSSLPSGSSDKAKMVETSDPMSRPSKLVKLDEGRSASVGGVHLLTSVSGQSQVSGAALFRNQTPEAGEAPNSEKKVQLQLPPDVESALLQQVLNLTPEQLSSLPPDQQQQVIQLQQILR